jgi:hypothetical protein
MFLQISRHLLIEVSAFLHRKEFAILFEFILIQRFLMLARKNIDIRADLFIWLRLMSKFFVRMSMRAMDTWSASSSASSIMF